MVTVHTETLCINHRTVPHVLLHTHEFYIFQTATIQEHTHLTQYNLGIIPYLFSHIQRSIHHMLL